MKSPPLQQKMKEFLCTKVGILQDDLSTDHGGSVSIIFQFSWLDLFLKDQEHYFIHNNPFKKEFVFRFVFTVLAAVGKIEVGKGTEKTFLKKTLR